jgi:hypothetical protein
MATPADVVRNYILAKDGNRPFLMQQAFAENAELEVEVRTDAISFPSFTRGLSAIEDVLVRRFGIDYENIYTFCLSQPADGNRHRFECRWLVGMSARSDGQIRVGCGRYDWHFGSDDAGLAKKLIIVIDVMKIFPANEQATTMKWLSGLPYPWCTAGQAARDMPRGGEFAAIEAYLSDGRPVSR